VKRLFLIVLAALALSGCSLDEQQMNTSTGSATSSGETASCDSSYPDFCIPPIEEVGDLDCADVGGSDFTVLAPDPHGFDADGDGIGCES
jgi:hypothetical protein